MQPDGNCGYNVTCRSKAGHTVQLHGRTLADEVILADDILAMCLAKKEEQEHQLLQKSNAELKGYDWPNYV